MASQEDKNKGGYQNWLYYLKGRHVEEWADFSLWIYREEHLEYTSKEWKFQGDKLNQECGYGPRISSELLVTGNIQEKLDGPFSGMLWREIVLNRKLVYRTFKSFPIIFRGQGQEILERPKLIFRLQSSCNALVHFVYPAKLIVSISVLRPDLFSPWYLLADHLIALVVLSKSSICSFFYKKIPEKFAFFKEEAGLFSLTVGVKTTTTTKQNKQTKINQWNTFKFYAYSFLPQFKCLNGSLFFFINCKIKGLKGCFMGNKSGLDWVYILSQICASWDKKQ